MGFRDLQTRKPEPAPSQTTAAAKPTTQPRTTVPVTAPKAGRYTGLRPAEGRSPFLEAGDHCVRFVETKEVRTKSKPPWLKTEVEILQSDTIKAGSKRTIRKVISETAFEMSGPEILSMLMAAMGFEALQMAEFEEAHPDWDEMLDAVHGMPDAVEKFGENPLAGLTAKVSGYTVETEDGKTFVNCTWEPWSPAAAA